MLSSALWSTRFTSAAYSHREVWEFGGGTKTPGGKPGALSRLELPCELKLWGGRCRSPETGFGELQDDLVFSIAHDNAVVTDGLEDKPVDGLADAGGDAAAGTRN